MATQYFERFKEAIRSVSSEDSKSALDGDTPLLDDQYRYPITPTNSVPFSTMGVDGVHTVLLKIDGKLTDASPVVQVGPMDFAAPYVVVAESFLNYLSVACSVSEEELKLHFETNPKELVAFLAQRFKSARLFSDPQRLKNLEKYLCLIETANSDEVVGYTLINKHK